MTTTWSELPLSGAVDRAAERRGGAGALAEILSDDETRIVLVHRGRLASDGASEPSAAPWASAGAASGRGNGAVASRLDLVPAASVRGVAPTPDHQPVVRWLLLGVVDGAAVLALVLPDDADHASPGLEGIAERGPWARLARERTWSSLRELAGALSPDEAALAASAVALAAWHGNHPRCPRCGEPTVATQCGWVRRCLAEGVDHFPRTDPAVIMTVVDEDDRLLLGHNAAWAAGRFSTLAGYVEPGESIEQAVRREVHEEVGLSIGEVSYRASQPWPFPASLMLGFRAHATSIAIVCDGTEVDDARWFSRDELRTAVDGGEVVLPGRTSIARALVQEWFGEELPGA